MVYTKFMVYTQGKIYVQCIIIPNRLPWYYSIRRGLWSVIYFTWHGIEEHIGDLDTDIELKLLTFDLTV